MAVSATPSSLSTFSSLSLYTPPPRFSLFTQTQFHSLSSTLSQSLSTKLKPIKAQEQEQDQEVTITDQDTIFFTNDDPEGVSTFDPPEIPEGFEPPPSFDDGPQETEDEIAAAYEELYGPAYSGVSLLGNDIYVMDSKVKKSGALGKIKKEKVRDGFDERVIQVRRVTKVVKGGKQLHFRAVVVVGDKKGQVGVGVGKAKEVVAAVQKSATNARRNIVTVPMTKYSTFPHRADGDYGAAKVMLRPASPGTGVIAGGAVRIVLEMAGVENALGKQLGSNNALNNARATVVAVQQMRQFSEVARDRGIPMEELWK
ncbi:small ribosomal subunit protein uS5c [Apium graveolens]|uniref:small ribosomal subunit protein uS5c n=1 Tax=Apium graveolens TaxID=4045 RepID=UPI003D7ACFF3